MLGDDIAWALPQLRRQAESLMLDRCTITRPDPNAEPGEMDPETGQYPEPARRTIYSGKCRIQVKSIIAGSSGTASGERLTTIQEAEWQGPVMGTEGVAVNDVIHVDSAASDPALVGRQLTVAALHQKSQATSRRLRVQEVTA